MTENLYQTKGMLRAVASLERKAQSSFVPVPREKPVTSVSCSAHRGQFSIAVSAEGRTARYPISKDRDRAELYASHVADSLLGGAFSDVVTPPVREILRKRIEFAKSRAYTRDMEFDLTLEWLIDLYNYQVGRCAVSGLRLDVAKRERNVNGWKRPFSPSLDRIDSSRGYLQDNCRIVCSAVNNAMGSWGEGVLHLIARALTRQD